MNKRLEGVGTYTIEKDGCLTGYYANNAGHRAGEAFNEIAKKKHRDTHNDIKGDYVCAWSEYDEGAEDVYIVHGELHITAEDDYYLLTWLVKDENDGQLKPRFVGKGFRTQQNVLTVRYTTA